MLPRIFVFIFLAIDLGVAPATGSVADSPSGAEPVVDRDRLERVYVLLKAAEDAATGAVVTSADDVKKHARAMTYEDLKKACEQSVKHTRLAIAEAPPSRRPETFAQIKNADLRLHQDREEPYQGHIWYTQQHPEKLMTAIREFVKDIQAILPKIKPAA